MYLLGEQSAWADALINRLQSLPALWLRDLRLAGLLWNWKRRTI
jgi:hypothetical protein